MNNTLSVLRVSVPLALALALSPPASAAIMSVSQEAGNSSLGAAATVLSGGSLPSDVLDDLVVNRGQQGFDEAQGVLTSVDHSVDGGSIGKGTRVDSHLIFLNTDGTTGANHHSVVWTFDGVILGVMSDKQAGKSGGVVDLRARQSAGELHHRWGQPRSTLQRAWA